MEATWMSGGGQIEAKWTLDGGQVEAKWWYDGGRTEAKSKPNGSYEKEAEGRSGGSPIGAN